MDQDTPPPRKRGRPATGVTPKRNIRVDALWDRVEALAAPEAMTDVIKRLLKAEERRLLRRAQRDQDAGDEQAP